MRRALQQGPAGKEPHAPDHRRHRRTDQRRGGALGTLTPATQVRHDALRDRLLRAAAAAIEAGGLLNIRARALAEEAGCAVGAIYGVFPDLDALILAVNAHTLDDVAAALHQAGHHPRPADQLAALADAYLAYARTHRQRWRALFQHRLPPGRPMPPDYATRLQAAFAVLDAPLAALRPGLPDADRALLARTLFSAVHGIVDLGLDEKVAELTPEVLAGQIDGLVRAIAAGLAGGGPSANTASLDRL